MMKPMIQKILLLIMTAALVVLAPSPAMAYGMTPYGAFVAAAVCAGFLMLNLLRKRDAGSAAIGMFGRIDAVELAVFVVPAAFVGARLLYCLVRFGFYFMEMGPLSVLRVWEGGFLLYGAAIGACAAAVWLSRKRGVSPSATLDELAAPGLLAIAVARLGEWSVGEGLGTWIENEAFMRLPFAVMNEYEEWQLAVFLFEAAVALILMIPVLREKPGEGRRMETALLLYACCQIVMESLRMDSCLKIGFVRVSQVASALAILLVTMLRANRHGGRRLMLRRFVLLGVCVAVVGGLEWALDKTPLNNFVLYAVMIAACAAMAVGGMRFEGQKRIS